MNRAVAVGSFASGVIVAAAIIVVTGETPSADSGISSGRPVGSISARQNPEEMPADYHQRWAADSLARPLFAPDRRPIALASQTKPGEGSGLPRLSGIMITQSSRSAIFVPSGGGKSEVVTEGGTIGAYRVQSISAEQIVLTGPHGRQNLRPSFDGMRPVGPVPPVTMQAPQKESAP